MSHYDIIIVLSRHVESIVLMTYCGLEVNMRVLTSFIIFVISFTSFIWIIRKTKISEKILNKVTRVKYYNFILACMFFLFMFLLEYGKYSLNELYGLNSCISVAFAGTLGSIYVNFVPFMF